MQLFVLGSRSIYITLILIIIKQAWMGNFSDLYRYTQWLSVSKGLIYYSVLKNIRYNIMSLEDCSQSLLEKMTLHFF